jgi:hypothetical protein
MGISKYFNHLTKKKDPSVFLAFLSLRLKNPLKFLPSDYFCALNF